MPQMDGRQLADALRALLVEPPRMIALSGFGQERDRAESIDRGFHAHLVKPANVGELLAALDGPRRLDERRTRSGAPMG